MTTPATAPTQETLPVLRDPDDIAAAGAEAVQDWRLTDRQCDQLAAVLADATQAPQTEGQVPA